MAVIQGKFMDKAQLLLEATLDSFANPAWITDKNGGTMLNEEARRLVREGFSIKNAMLYKDMGSLSIKGKKFRINIKELNHGTECYLHELRPDDDATNRLKECASVLDAAIKRK